MSVRIWHSRSAVIVINSLALLVYFYVTVHKALSPGYSASINSLWVEATAPIATILAFSARPERKLLFLLACVLNILWLVLLAWGLFVLSDTVLRYVDSAAISLLIFTSILFFAVPLFTVAACIYHWRAAGL